MIKIISTGVIIQKEMLNKVETETYLINLDKLNVKIETIENKLCIVLENKKES